MEVEGAVVLVTGGASGLGAGVARAAIDAGASVGVLDLPGPRGEELVAELGDRAALIPVDVTDPDQVRAAVDGCAEAFGRIDLGVGCAGVPDAARIVDRHGEMFPLDVFAKVVGVNLVGAFDVLRNCARHMATNPPGPDGERGAYVNISSIAAFDGQAGQAAYAASKAGLVGLTLTAARDLASHGIRVVTVCPGAFDTAMTAGVTDVVRERILTAPVFPRRFGTAAELADLVLTVATNRMLNGEVIRLDAGARLGHG